MKLAKKECEFSVPDEDNNTDLKNAVYRVLFGIEKTWELGQQGLADILHRRSSTISDWKTNEAVGVSPQHPSPNDTQIYEFIEFYDAVSSLFIRKEDQIAWLRSPSPDFGGQSPLELLKINSKNLFVLREWVEHLANP